MWKEFEVEVVQDDVLGLVVPIVEVELSAKVHGLAKRSSPLSLPESGCSDKYKAFRSFHDLCAEGGDWGPPDVRQIE